MADLSPIESEFATSEDAAAYDAWFRAKVEKTLTAAGKTVPHDAVMAKVVHVIGRYRSK
jgi:hypothetical protein